MNEKNKYGQYFTIDLIADFMVKLISHPKNNRILEPSCGKGVFLDNLEKQNFKNIKAYEIDLGLKEFNPQKYITYKSFLGVPVSEKYDVVIGNPPYIRWKNLEPELKKELENNYLWNKYFNSLCDYLFVFILKSIEHLEEGGELIFICTDYWLHTTHSQTLRNYMCEQGYFSEIYHFKEAPLFEKVTASFIIFKFIKSQERKDSITLWRYNQTKGLPTSGELLTKSCFKKEIIPHFKENERWLLATANQQVRLQQFENICRKPGSNLFENELKRIGDYCDIGNGMVSGLDAAFQINESENLNSDEKKTLIEVMKAKDLQPYKNKSKTTYIFIQENISPDKFKLKYPNFYSHFKPYISKLTSRYSYNRLIPYWEFVFPRNQKLLERNEGRIFIPCKERISNKNYFRFCYAPQGVYSTQDVTAILRKKNTKESLEYILAYLNNHRIFEWLSLNGIVKGDIVEFSEAPIASIPFKAIDWNNPDEVRIHDNITEEVKNYLCDEDKKHLENINSYFNCFFK